MCVVFVFVVCLLLFACLLVVCCLVGRSVGRLFGWLVGGGVEQVLILRRSI